MPAVPPFWNIEKRRLRPAAGERCVLFVAGDSGAGKSTLIERDLRHGWADSSLVKVVSVSGRLREAGALAPGAAFGDDGVVADLIEAELTALFARDRGVLIVDGYPRRAAQAHSITQLARAGRQNLRVGVLWLIFGLEEAADRLFGDDPDNRRARRAFINKRHKHRPHLEAALRHLASTITDTHTPYALEVRTC
jgi:adenylate kinase family enzyme